ncbi:hypothetical protein QCA50_011046 [Cerrena zonata]|uniref:Peptidase M20 dimerisation domain-containing protein n=1 Tax=Cerrena zonata TaxID=2478898 RepID=A0AAW0G016_9APHY
MSLPRPTDGKTGQRLWGIVRSLFCGITTNKSHERRYSIPNTMTKDTPPPSPTSTNTTLLEKGDVAPPSYTSNHTCAMCGNESWNSSEIQEVPRSRSYPISRGSSVTIVDEKDSTTNSIPSPQFSEYVKTIESTMDSLSDSLRTLSKEIWGMLFSISPRTTITEIRPSDFKEVAYEEKKTHDALTKYMSDQGFIVTPHYHKGEQFETAWKAVYTSPAGKGRTIGLNSEMDALPGIGHACGHNLIAVSGVAVAVALKAFLENHNQPGQSSCSVHLQTDNRDPFLYSAEEHGGGKIRLYEEGAYDDMDVCIMCHPSPGPPNGSTIAPWLALQPFEVEFTGHSAHAAYAPWDGKNALDAAFLAYSSVSVLRQQLKPAYRVHGIVSGSDWEPNVIPNNANMRWIIRAPTRAELEQLRSRIIACFNAAAMATGCEVKIVQGAAYYDVRENSVLGDEYCRLARRYFGVNSNISDQTIPASTDFGNITYKLPCITPIYNIPTKPGGSNHTLDFAESAKAIEAHEATMTTSKSLAATAIRVLTDTEFYNSVRQSFEASIQNDPKDDQTK